MLCLNRADAEAMMQWARESGPQAWFVVADWCEDQGDHVAAEMLRRKLVRGGSKGRRWLYGYGYGYGDGSVMHNNRRRRR